ncbi:MAG: CoA pyrophosphatase [Trueperaceae bacterium]|nr:CoA pyrophosphatase [Trueperaceae bacterium]
MSDASLVRLRWRLGRRPGEDALTAQLVGFRRAAVLVPILTSAGGAELLFTVRSRALPHHAGQISFPGGGVEANESPEQAARREAFEEVGLEVPEDALVGRLSDLPSPAGYVATPVVAVLPSPRRLRIDPGEVEEAFTVPLRDLRSTPPTTEVRSFRGAPRTLHRYVWGERDIWGFTGNVVRELLEMLGEPGEEDRRW